MNKAIFVCLFPWYHLHFMMNLFLTTWFPLNFFAKFPNFPWFFGTQVPWLSLISARSVLQGSHIFSTSKFKEFQGENLHNFTEILFMNKIIFVANFSTPTYDVRWMCFNFTHNLINIVGSIDLHNSLQTFSVRMVWQLRTLK